MEAKPIACSLEGDDRTARARWLGTLADRALGVDWRADGATVTFPAEAELEAELRALARAESECCPFLTIALRRADGTVELDVSGPPDARPVIDEMLASGQPSRR
jgi:hypothetical protein